MTLETLYNTLRSIISENFAITITDKTMFGASVSIKPTRNSHPWTHFFGKDISEALRRAIDKFQNPSKDYVDFTGHKWFAKEESCFDEQHIKQFLKETQKE